MRICSIPKDDRSTFLLFCVRFSAGFSSDRWPAIPAGDGSSSHSPDRRSNICWWPWAAACDCNPHWRAAQRPRNTPAFQQVQQLYEQYEAGNMQLCQACCIAASSWQQMWKLSWQWLHDGEPALTQRL
jgi:hypothetical protein